MDRMMKFEYDTYLEAKSKASNSLKEEERIVGVHIYRKRDEHKWVVEITKCSDRFFDMFINKEWEE